MKYDLILGNAQTVIPSENSPFGLKTEQLDVAISAGQIVQIGSLAKTSAQRFLDLKGLHLLPGLIDSQVHFREPGLEHKEDLESGTKGALLGGITAIFEMPNTNPSTTTHEAFEDKMQRAAQRCWTHYGFFIGASPDNIDQLADLEKRRGCVGVKIFMGSSTGSLLVENDEDLEKILASGRRRVAVHSEDEMRLRERKTTAIQRGRVHSHPLWRDEETAIRSTQRLLRLVQKTGRPTHVLHITTKEEIALLAAAKAQGLPITVECTPQHLTLSAPDCYDRLGTRAQMNPPIRTLTHTEGLWRGLNDGCIDVIGSDHAPHTLEEKAKEYPQSPSGMTGVQTLVPLMLNHINDGRLSLEHFVRLASQNPAEIYHCSHKGRIAIGQDTDFTIVDLKAQRTIRNDWIASRSGWTPFDGHTVKGWPVGVVLKGQLALWQEEIQGRPCGQACAFDSTQT